VRGPHFAWPILDNGLAIGEFVGSRQGFEHLVQGVARLTLAETVVALQQVGKELTPAVKKRFAAKDLERIRRAYAGRLANLKAPAADKEDRERPEQPDPGHVLPAPASKGS